MKKPRIRPLALCVFQHDRRILVSENYDPTKRETFYRPLGGGIEFGERGIDAAAREIQEELTAEVCELAYLGALENIFTFNGKPGHEIVLIYDGSFVDPTLYGRESLTGHEGSHAFKAVWKHLSDFVPATRRCTRTACCAYSSTANNSRVFRLVTVLHPRAARSLGSARWVPTEPLCADSTSDPEVMHGVGRKWS